MPNQKLIRGRGTRSLKRQGEDFERILRQGPSGGSDWHDQSSRDLVDRQVRGVWTTLVG